MEILFIRPSVSLARARQTSASHPRPSTLAHNKAGRGNVPWHSRVSCFSALFAPWKRAAPTPIEFPDSIKYFSLARLASPSCQGTTNANDSLVKWRPTPPTACFPYNFSDRAPKTPGGIACVRYVPKSSSSRDDSPGLSSSNNSSTVSTTSPFLPLFKLAVCYWVFLLFLRSLVFLFPVSYLLFVPRFSVLCDLSVPPCTFAWALRVHLPPVFLFYRFWSILLFSFFTVAFYRSRLISFRSTSLPLFSRKLLFLLLSFERLFSVFCKLQGGFWLLGGRRGTQLGLDSASWGNKGCPIRLIDLWRILFNLKSITIAASDLWDQKTIPRSSRDTLKHPKCSSNLLNNPIQGDKQFYQSQRNPTLSANKIQKNCRLGSREN